MPSRGFLLLEGYLLGVYIIITYYRALSYLHCNNLSVYFHVTKAIVGLLLKEADLSI